MKKLYFSVIVSLFIGFTNSCTPSVNNHTDGDSTPAKTAKKDPLPSWNNSDTKSAILAYVSSVTNKSSENFIPVSERIATFDNDGTLWSEQPAYFQLFFAIDNIKSRVKNHPEWKDEQPYKSVIEDNMEALGQLGEEALLQLVLTSHSGSTQQEFEKEVQDWIATSKHPTQNVGYDKLVYQPMLELLNYLWVNNFKTYIVSGGGVDFMRAFVSEIYGIPSEQIIGTRLKTLFDYNNGNPVINRLPQFEFIDDKEGKPLNIQKIIGKKPVFAGGNSDGDLQMMQWTVSNSYPSFVLYIHHTDSIREWAYDRDSHFGRFDKGLDEALSHGWVVTDMAKDWNIVFPFEMNK